MLNRRPRLLLYSFFLLIGLLVGCTRPINRAAERRIREALPDLLGSARQYRVHVIGAAISTVQGRLDEIIVDGDDVQFPHGLLIDHLHLDLKGVDFDTGHHVLRHIESAQFTVRIGQNSLDEMLAGEMPDGETLREVRVTLSGNNEVTIRGKRVVLSVGVPFELNGPLRVAGPKRLEMDPNRLTVIGIPITGRVLNFLKGRFENGIDLSSLPFPVQLTGVSTEPGALTISGTADVAALIQQGKR